MVKCDEILLDEPALLTDSVGEPEVAELLAALEIDGPCDVGDEINEEANIFQYAGGYPMTKADLVEIIQDKADMSKMEAMDALGG